MPLSEFEKQRQENIQRNKELLRSLNLDSISESINKELPANAAPAPKKRRAAGGAAASRAQAAAKREPAEPSRRSRRLAGVKTENNEEYEKLQREAEERERKKKEVEKLRSTRLYGNFRLIDLVTDPKGDWKNEARVLQNGASGASGATGRKKGTAKVKKEEEEGQDGVDADDAEVSEEQSDAVLDILKGLGEKFSAGDFYDLIRESKAPAAADYDIEKKRKEFDALDIYERFDPLDIKITHQRITSIAFHPSTTDRVIAVGDTVGDLGIWAVDAKSSGDGGDGDDEDEPTISIVKPHGKLVSKLLTPATSPTSIYSSSYDGSVRSLDLNKLKSTELCYISDPYVDGDAALGVSDIHLASPDNHNLLYMTTLSGNFYQHDIRQPLPRTIARKALLRLHDKKIGGFAVNPNASHQIATASLDRTLRVWDLRNASESNSAWSEYELDHQQSPHCYGSYTSRLSVSCVSWNRDNHLVCNGYDDQIALFDLDHTGTAGVVEWAQDYQPGVDPKPAKKRNAPAADPEELIQTNLKPLTKIKHNCQTGRWVSILKSHWQLNPADGVQKFCIANMNRGIDIYDQKGQILAHLTGEKVGAVPAVATMHPSQNWAVGGSASGKLYLFE